MKIKLLVLCFFVAISATAAFSQSNGTVLSSEINSGITFTSHQMRASQQPATLEQSLLTNSANISGHGERPLWEFAQPKEEKPLGDVAREYRRERAENQKKPVFVHQN